MVALVQWVTDHPALIAKLATASIVSMSIGRMRARAMSRVRRCTRAEPHSAFSAP